MSKEQLTSLIDSFNDKENMFQLQPVTCKNIEKCKMIQNDCLMGYDQIPASLIKPVSEFLVAPTTFTANNFIKINEFSRDINSQKLAKISPIPKIQLPVNLETNDQYPFYQYYQ